MNTMTPNRPDNPSITKLNIGCGPTGQFPNFVNLDNSPSIWLSKFPSIKRILHRMGKLTDQQLKDDWSGAVKCDASRHLPYADGSVHKIYSSHFLEHIPPTKGFHVLKECYRVLRPDGIFRLVVPDLLWHAEQYVKRTRQLMDTQPEIIADRKSHDAFLESVYGAYLNRRRYGLLHCYMYDWPTLTEILTSIGFKTIQRFDYRQGNDRELAALDSRPEDSLHLEISKS